MGENEILRSLEMAGVKFSLDKNSDGSYTTVLFDETPPNHLEPLTFVVGMKTLKNLDDIAKWLEEAVQKEWPERFAPDLRISR